MSLTEREQRVWDEMKAWEYQLGGQDTTDFQMMYDKWMDSLSAKLSRGERGRWFVKADQWLFHLHAFMQSSQSQLDARNRILSTARLFHDRIEHIEDLRELSIDELRYIAEHQMARHRIYSLVQGGAAGTGGILLLGADLPLMAVLNLKAVQLIATAYGYDVNKPYEMMLALKVFHASILPTRLQQYAWQDLLQELDGDEYSLFFYNGIEEVTDAGSVSAVLKQLVKTLLIYSLRRKVFQGIPLLGIAVGSTVNYRLTRNVTEFANRFYQKRYLLEKRKA